jgi:CO/xanthine dehydrogenase FAD-binding subunit
MRLSPPVNYYRAKSEREALSILGDLRGRAALIAGGTDFLAGRYVERVENLVDISGVKELCYVRNEMGTVKIGALTTHTQVSMSDTIKKEAFALADAESAIGTVEIRNRGTIGGNICNASPCADTVPPLMVLDSKLKISSKPPFGLSQLRITVTFLLTELRTLSLYRPVSDKWSGEG